MSNKEDILAWCKERIGLIVGFVALTTWLGTQYVLRHEYLIDKTMQTLAIEGVKTANIQIMQKATLGDLKLEKDQAFEQSQEAAASLEYLQRVVREQGVDALNPVQKDRLARLESRLPKYQDDLEKLEQKIESLEDDIR